MTHERPPAGTEVVLVTGPTSGLGLALVHALARQGRALVLLGRSAEKLAAVEAECRAFGAPAVQCLVADVAKQKDVRAAAARFLASGWPLHVLVHNAGLINQRRRITEDDIEETFAVGTTSPYLLTALLLPKLVESAPSQIIHTTSGTYPIGTLDLDDVRFDRGYGPIKSYAASKLANVGLTLALARRLAPHGVRVNVYNPGMNYTNLAVGNNEGALKSVGDFFWRRIADPVEDGITVPLRLVTDPALRFEQGAVYMSGARVEPTRTARDPHFQEAVLELCEAKTGTPLPRWLTPRPPGAGTVRIGVLGAARIAPFSLLRHAKDLPGVEVVALAEQHQPLSRAVEYAREHGIPRVYGSFRRLLDDPTIDAVYLALPISQHAEWAIETIRAGKHLLCEKPLAANADEARAVEEAAAGSGLVVAEAMHSRQHPLVARLRDIVASGELGALQRVDANFSAYLPQRDFRFVYELGGGCMLDMGCYPIALLRAILGTEPDVVSARAVPVEPRIDGEMHARLRFPNAPDTRVFVAMRSLRRPLEVSMRFVGSEGTLELLNFMKPEVYHHVVVTTKAGRRFEHVPGGSTYAAQLAAFVGAIRGGAPMPTTVGEAVRTLRVVDAIYRAAGMPVRGMP